MFGLTPIVPMLQRGHAVLDALRPVLIASLLKIPAQRQDVVARVAVVVAAVDVAGGLVVFAIQQVVAVERAEIDCPSLPRVRLKV